MRNASGAVLVLAALCFLAGTLNLLLKTQLLGRDALTWWHGSVGFIGFAIAIILWETLRIHERKQ